MLEYDLDKSLNVIGTVNIVKEFLKVQRMYKLCKKMTMVDKNEFDFEILINDYAIKVCYFPGFVLFFLSSSSVSIPKPSNAS
jgi:hypothetical protein